MAEPFVSATPPNAAPAAAPVAHVDAKVMDQKEPAANKRKSNWEEIRGGKGSDASWKQGRGWARDDRQQFEKPHPGSFAVEELERIDAEAAAREAAGEPAVPELGSVGSKKKMAICFGYCGAEYFGMQMNPGMKTLEQYLERAIFRAGGISRTNLGYFQKIGWSRCARTDKGVSALSQVVSLNMVMPPDKTEAKVVEELNANLPTDMRVFSVTATTKSFDAKNACAKRRYHYLLPSFMLMPPDQLGAVFAASGLPSSAAPSTGQPGNVAGASPEALAAAAAELKRWRVGSSALTRLRAGLALFRGTHKFHNFTTRKSDKDPSANRHIYDFTATDAFVVANDGSHDGSHVGDPTPPRTEDGFMAEESNACEWVLLEVEGMSFLLHQIRKMVATAVDLSRRVAPLPVHDGPVDTSNSESAGTAPSSSEATALTAVLEAAFGPRKMSTPMAPALGLYLDAPFFTQYNKSVKSGSIAGGRGEREPLLDWPDGEPAHLVQFKKEVIWKHIFSTESRDHGYVEWLNTQNVFPADYAVDPVDKKAQFRKVENSSGSGSGIGKDDNKAAADENGADVEDAGAYSDS